MKHTDAWPIWDGAESLQGRRIRLDYPNGRAYAVGVAELSGRNRQTGWYHIAGTGILFGAHANRVRVAPEGER